MPRRPPYSPFILRFWSLLFVLLGLGCWWLTRSHAGSWASAAVLNFLPLQVLMLWPLLLAYRAWQCKKPGWMSFNLLAALVFAVAVVGFVLPHSRPVATGTPLTLLSLNANFASASPEKLAEVALREGAQVVTIQEALDKQRRAEPFESNLRAAFPGWVLVRHDELLTLTRLPVLGHQVLSFPHSPHALLLTRVRVSGQAVDILNAHLPVLGLQATASDRELGRPLPQRLQRTLDIRRDFQQVVGQYARQTTRPLLLVGDLNAPPRGGISNQLRAVGYHDAFAQAGWGFGFTHHALLGHSRIDYVWLRGPQAEAARPLRDLLSDHRALLVRVKLPE